MDTKICFKCSTEKPLSEFYKHGQMRLGYSGKCKECTKSDVKARYNDPDNRDKIVSYEKRRTQSVHRKQKALEYQKNKRHMFPEKYYARTAAGNAIRDGRLKKEPCHYCGELKVQAHHHDYSRPLDVKWVCFKCHREHEHGQKVTSFLS